MKLFDSSKFELIGYDNGARSPYRGWVLRERSFRDSFTPQIVIIDKCKFIDNGRVYYLNSDGKYCCSHHGEIGALALNYDCVG